MLPALTFFVPFSSVFPPSLLFLSWLKFSHRYLVDLLYFFFFLFFLFIFYFLVCFFLIFFFKFFFFSFFFSGDFSAFGKGTLHSANTSLSIALGLFVSCMCVYVLVSYCYCCYPLFTLDFHLWVLSISIWCFEWHIGIQVYSGTVLIRCVCVCEICCVLLRFWLFFWPDFFLPFYQLKQSYREI